MSLRLLFRFYPSTTSLRRSLLYLSPTREFHYSQCLKVLALPSQSVSPVNNTSNFWRNRENIPAASCLYVARCYSKKAKKKKASGASSELYQDEKTKGLIDLAQVQQEMQEVLLTLKDDYVRQLSADGRTAFGALENIMVSTKHGKLPLNQLGQITMKSAQLIHINMASVPQEIDIVVKSIEKSGLSLNPRVDQGIIEVTIPKVTKEHRESLTRVAKEMCQKCKDTLKTIRNNHAKMVKKAKGSKGLSSDAIIELEKQIQHLMEDSVKQADELHKKKTSELLGS